MTDLQITDVGVVVELTITDGTDAIDLSSASTMEIVIRGPTSASITKTATFTTDGTDGKIRFTTGVADFVQTGNYQIQGHIIDTGQDWTTSLVTVLVGPNL